MPHSYYIDSPSESVFQAELDSLGLLSWKLDADNYDKDGKLDAICKERNYNYKDFVDSTKIPNLQEKLAIFFEEHIHDDEEIRFFVDGSGFFDIRDQRKGQDRWVRIECQKGDLIILPAGIYHRFNPDDKMFFKVMRLFCGDPVWTPWNRIDAATDARPARRKYVDTFLQTGA
eukprot:TRINITY_DN27567_c0_g1_i1.p1 TRINITY_DN27567_c0_g1~~TRINITY_DN27567_c0_g1_i1.p1  ORF type:complete len:189 (+),score=35.17 TRINITY_DN27567_c0_g1_i1:49-567(+)